MRNIQKLTKKYYIMKYKKLGKQWKQVIHINISATMVGIVFIWELDGKKDKRALNIMFFKVNSTEFYWKQKTKLQDEGLKFSVDP